ncbi:MAG: hypothetical protein DMF68_09555 [Acidobacteria bacterium]|nr:MAG: hypothetical protein DMF68_09555 [Acidobacteriota bacterium]
MAGKKSSRKSDEHLDLLGQEIIRASASNEEEAERAATSPFSYARLRSRLSEETERREEGERWFTMLKVVWRAVPAMALVAIFAIALFLSTSFSSRSSNGFSDEALLGERGTEVESVVFADTRNISNDDVLATVMSEDDQEPSR